MNRLINRLKRFRNSLDTLFAASAMAQAGEVDYARRMLLEAEREEACCGQVAVGKPCAQISMNPCCLALQHQG